MAAIRAARLSASVLVEEARDIGPRDGADAQMAESTKRPSDPAPCRFCSTVMRLPVLSKSTNELKDWRAGPFRSSSTHGEPQIWGVSEAMSAIRVPRPVPKLGPFEIDHKSAA